MKNFSVVVFWCVSLNISLGASAAESGKPGEREYQSCIACHGAKAEGIAALGAPALAAQDADYLARQLTQFREGTRGASPDDTRGAQMRAMAGALTDAEIQKLALYLGQIAAQPVEGGLASSQADPQKLRNGSNYYQANCGACHGGKAEGNAALGAPNLAILNSDYIKRQVQNYQKGLRGSGSGDRFGRQMQLMSNTLPSEDDLDDVIAFIVALGAK